MSGITRILMLAGAWVACGVGFVGVFVPVLPTTPLLLLATFLFARSSPRCHRWIQSTKVYQSYVRPFKEAGGIPLRSKIRILLVSYAVMGVSAILVDSIVARVGLVCVAVFLFWLIFARIPTVERQSPPDSAPKA